MTDKPYTDEDLRTEAAKQHKTATEDPDFMGIGEAMEDSAVQSTDDGTTSLTWAELLVPEGGSYEAFDEPQRKIHDLINHAADVSEWAINLGADGLEPEEHQFTLNAGPRPIIRVHFAFAPELSEEARTAFVEGLGAAAAREMQLALNSE